MTGTTATVVGGSGASDGDDEQAGPDEQAGLTERALAQIPKVVHTPEPADDPIGYERSAASALRLISSILLALMVMGLAELLPRASRGLERDLQLHAGSWAR